MEHVKNITLSTKKSYKHKAKPKLRQKHTKHKHILKSKQKVEKFVLDIAIKVARQGSGALFVIGNLKKGKHYICMYPNLFEKKKLNIFRKGIIPLVQKLSMLDGAIIIKPNGELVAYGARIKKQKNMSGYGTRHAAARGISLHNALAIVCSEEHHIMRIFKEGNIIMEINPYTKTVEKNLDKIIRILNAPETSAMLGGALGSAIILGTATAGAVTATAVLPGVVFFTGGYIISRKIMNLLEVLQKKQ